MLESNGHAQNSAHRASFSVVASVWPLWPSKEKVTFDSAFRGEGKPEPAT